MAAERRIAARPKPSARAANTSRHNAAFVCVANRTIIAIGGQLPDGHAHLSRWQPGVLRREADASALPLRWSAPTLVASGLKHRSGRASSVQSAPRMVALGAMIPEAASQAVAVVDEALKACEQSMRNLEAKDRTNLPAYGALKARHASLQMRRQALQTA